MMEVTWEDEVDRTIDEVIVGRTSGGMSGRNAEGPLDLLWQLGDLREVDWPDATVPDRIAARLATKLGEKAPALAPLPDDESLLASHHHPRRLGGVRASIAVPAAVLLLVVVTAAAVGVSGLGTHIETRPGGNSSVATPNLEWHLVDAVSSPFQSVAVGPQTGGLDCVSTTVCYTTTGGAEPGGVAPGDRTVDGGKTWQSMAPLPGALAILQPLTCLDSTTCIGAGFSFPASLRLFTTTDGGAHWNVETAPAPASVPEASIDQLACASIEHCVIHVESEASTETQHLGTFLVTTDGGATWTAASSVPAPATDDLDELRCDANGTCLGIVDSAPIQVPGGIDAVRSTDGGKTWTAEPPALTLGPGTMEMSCADTLHCMVIYASPTPVGLMIATTVDGGATWQTSAAPSTWPQTGLAVSCATDEDCWVSAANASSQGYSTPVIEETRDGGATWSSLPLPSVGGSPLALVAQLSCPTPAGCIGVGATPAQFDPQPPPPGLHPGQGTEIVSNLPN